MHIFLDKGHCEIIKSNEREFDGSNPYMEFGRKLIKMTLVSKSDLSWTLIGGSHFYGLLAYRPTERNNIFKLDLEFDESNPYMKFGRNLIKND